MLNHIQGWSVIEDLSQSIDWWKVPRLSCGFVCLLCLCLDHWLCLLEEHYIVLWWGLNSYALLFWQHCNILTYCLEAGAVEVLRHLHCRKMLIFLTSLFLWTKMWVDMYMYDLTVLSPPLSACMYSPFLLVAQLGMSSCSVAGVNERLWGKSACNRLLKTSVCFQLLPVALQMWMKRCRD